MVRSLFLAGLLATFAGEAQTVALSWPTQETETLRINAVECTARLRVDWTSAITGVNALSLCSDLKLWSTEQECADLPNATANEVRYPSVDAVTLANQTGFFEVPVAELPAFRFSDEADGGVSCGAQGIERNHKICGSVSVSNVSTGLCTAQQARSLTLIYDTKPPGAPTITELSEQDSALVLKFTAPADAVTVYFDVRAEGTGSFVNKGKIAVSTGSSIRLLGLVNATRYDVQARAEDAAGNFSPPSELVSGTPRLTKGFFGIYRDAGGAERGGCAAVPGLPLLLAGGLWLLRRKRN